MKYKIGDKVRCVSDSSGFIKPGTILTIESKKFYYLDGRKMYYFEETPFLLYTYEIEPVKKTIRDVQEGDIVINSYNFELEVLAVGKTGFCLSYPDTHEAGTWYPWEEAEEYKFKIKDEDEIIEISLEEIAELKGCDVSKLRIKE